MMSGNNESANPATPVSPPGSALEHTGNPLVRAWRGEEPLGVGWWGFGIPLKIIAWALGADWTIRVVYRNNSAVLLLVGLATIAAYVVITIMAWRCAPNTEEKGWKWVARGVLIAGWMWFAYKIVGSSGSP
jgi:hypothetical protein